MKNENAKNEATSCDWMKFLDFVSGAIVEDEARKIFFLMAEEDYDAAVYIFTDAYCNNGSSQHKEGIASDGLHCVRWCGNNDNKLMIIALHQEAAMMMN